MAYIGRVLGLGDFALEDLVLHYSDGVKVTYSFDTNQRGLWYWHRTLKRDEALIWDYKSTHEFERLRDCVDDALRHVELCKDNAPPVKGLLHRNFSQSEKPLTEDDDKT